MDIAKFHAAINAIAVYYKRSKIDEEFGALIASLDSMSANPGNIDVAKSFRVQLDALKVVLQSSKLNEMPADFYSIAEDLDILDYIGNGLYERLRQTLEENQLTPSLASAALTKLRTEVSRKLSLIVSTDSAFTTLGVPFEDYTDETAEVTIELPVERDSKTLEDLSKEAKDWHRIVDAICETFDEDRTRITIRSLATGSWLLYLAATPPFIYGIAKCLKGVNSILTELLKTKALYTQLVEAKYPKKVLQDAEKHTAGKVKTDLESLASSLVEEFYKGSDAGRKNELKNSLNLALNRLSYKLATGSKVNLRLTPPKSPTISDGEEPTEEQRLTISQIEKVEKIQLAIRESTASVDYLSHATELSAALPAPGPTDSAPEAIAKSI